MFNKILVAIDDGDNNQHILDEAIRLAQAGDAQLILTHVVPPLTEIYPEPGYIAAHGYHPTIHGETAVTYYMERLQALEQKGIELLQSFAKKARICGVDVEYVQATGSPGYMICKVARSRKVDLIIIGRHGRTGLAEFFLGSVSNYVLHHAACSVLTIQGQIDRHEADSLVIEAASI
ncbi:universal stress protein UspA-like protein [Rivularia sp. PCC 7116]|uniref:universal stress protein n=1 Tax=Rivularia sp. PCC 7116 TaxID=373994 RepID=UPI00029EE14D|nr:universal stress protein [Rivularia sp. PCC 7116]AFY55499.1 universal stress protein UspA-like protein [Rivularia sp. PCC 7116]